ncbi:plant UBX domain-containing protein 8-like [Abrus precatorius]|uniref:Plant UBX domain-containing protein 8-like n=1 Tax=Abrus precatorius TaxID=3816 RepID=A0A8B8K2R8_ABRPR|nr:plant UBX domain-containing protein 8-like [Abrus precatorius]
MATPEAVVAFMRITGAPEFVAVQKLEEYGGNLNEAVNAHFLEADRHILSGQGQDLSAAPHYNYSGASNQNNVGSRGIVPFLNAARSFRPSLLLDPNYRRELRDLYNGIGATAFTSHASPYTSHPGEARGVTAGISRAFEPRHQSGLSSTDAYVTGNVSSRGQGIHGTDDDQNAYTSTQSNTSDVPDNEIEEAMIQAAIEASKTQRREGSSWEQLDAFNDSSDGGLRQSHFQQEDDDLAHAISLSLETAEKEKALHELLAIEEKEGLGVHDSLAKGKKTNSSSLELGTSSNQNVAQDVAQPVVGHLLNHSAGGHSQGNEDVSLAEKWGGISYEELNEALLAENAFFGEISNHSSHKFSSLSDVQHHPEKYVDPKVQSLSCSTSQLLTETRLLKQQQDADYLASLRADKKKELNSCNKAETQSSKEEESHEKMLEKKELDKMLDKKEVRLSKEPLLDDENAITIVVRMPDGGRCERRFLKTDKLQLLFDFINIHGALKPGTYRVVKSYPRRAFSVNDSSSTLNEIGLSNKNEALFLELI